MSLGLVDDDEDTYDVTDRDYWIKKGSIETIKMVDEILNMVQTIDNEFVLKYNKTGISISYGYKKKRMIRFRPRKKYIAMHVKMEKDIAFEEEMEELGLDLLGYTRWGAYTIKLSNSDLKKYNEFLLRLFQAAYKKFSENI